MTVSDGTNSVTQDVTVTINNLNDQAPVIRGSYEQLYADENQTAIDTIEAYDPDGDIDTLTWSITGSEEINNDSVLAC